MPRINYTRHLSFYLFCVCVRDYLTMILFSSEFSELRMKIATGVAWIARPHELLRTDEINDNSIISDSLQSRISGCFLLQFAIHPLNPGLVD